MNNATIDLENFKTIGSKVFTGRNRGIDVRNESKIDQLEGKSIKIVIKIPEDIRSINPSFLEEFLLNVVSKLGKQKFYEKFEFQNQSKRYDIATDLDEAIDRILRNENALSKNN